MEKATLGMNAGLGMAAQMANLKTVNTNDLLAEIMDKLQAQLRSNELIKSTLQHPQPACKVECCEGLSAPWDEKTLNDKLSDISLFITRNNLDIEEIYVNLETLGGTKLV